MGGSHAESCCVLKHTSIPLPAGWHPPAPCTAVKRNLSLGFQHVPEPSTGDQKGTETAPSCLEVTGPQQTQGTWL